ncbi:MAG: hypothetical protein ACXVRM_06665 [Solirubrobacteraceae bacterium]
MRTPNGIRILLPAALCAVAAVPAAASARATPAGTAGPLPKLRAVSPLATAMPGARVPVRAVLKGRSVRTRLSYLLSANRRLSTSDVLLGGTTVPAVKAGHTVTVTRTLKFPARGKTGSWYLLTCLGAGAKPQCSAVPLPVLAKPSPRSVTVATDAGHAASLLTTASDGGTLTATGADGSTYALTVPAGALASDETITLTPVSALTGLRAGAPAAGAQISPDGLALLKPATLTITPAHPVPVADQIGYFWHATGRESGLYPPDPDPKSFTLTLNHFSGYELVDGNRVARKQLANQPTDLQERYADWVQAVADLRAAGNTGPAQDVLYSTLHDYLQTQFEAVIKPALAAAQTDDTLAFDALQRALTWAHQVQGLGGFGDEAAFVLQQMSAITDNALAQSVKRCSHNVAFTERVLYFARVRAALSLSSDANNLDALKLAEKCMQFQVDFTASTTENAGWQFLADVQVKDLKVPAIGIEAVNQLEKINPPPPPSTSVQYTRLAETTGAEGCAWSFGAPQEAEPFTVYRLSIDATLREVVGHNGHSMFQTPPPAISMEMTPGAYTEPFTVQCPHNSLPGVQKVYTGGWIVTHQSEVTPKGHWVLLNWTPGSDGILAQKSYDQTVTTPDGRGSIRQQSTLTIKYATGQ